MTISLNDILTISAPEEYKLHLACENPDGVHPLDEFVGHPDNWLGWNEWRGGRNDWTRPRVLSFMEFYPRSVVEIGAWWKLGPEWLIFNHSGPFSLAPFHFFGPFSLFDYIYIH